MPPRPLDWGRSGWRRVPRQARRPPEPVRNRLSRPRGGTLAVAGQEAPQEDAEEEAQEASEADAPPADEAGQVGPRAPEPCAPGSPELASSRSPRRRRSSLVLVARVQPDRGDPRAGARGLEPVTFEPTDGVRLAGRLFGPDRRAPASSSRTCSPPIRVRGSTSRTTRRAGIPRADVRPPRLLPRRRRGARRDEGRRAISRDVAGAAEFLRARARPYRAGGRQHGRDGVARRRRAEPARVEAVVTLPRRDAIDGLPSGPSPASCHRREAVHRRARRRRRGRDGTGALRGACRPKRVESLPRSTTAPTSSQGARARSPATSSSRAGAAPHVSVA